MRLDGKTLVQLRPAKSTLDLKSCQDALADKLSAMPESDSKLGECYQQYCDGLKNHRSIWGDTLVLADESSNVVH